jgi:hypothetical protein
MNKIITFILSLLVTGCFSFYSTHDCTIAATVVGSETPAANFPFRVVYPYDSYGVFFFLNAPSPLEGSLDEKGRVRIKVANFYEPDLVVGSTMFNLNEVIITSGGKPFKFPYRNDEQLYKTIKELYPLYKLPEFRYPEVDVVFEK